MEKHLSGERYKPEAMMEVYDAFEELDLPLYITEITVPTLEGENGEMIQATVLRNLYRLWFSTANMAGITYWNLGDSMAYGTEDKAMSGLVDKEMNTKESYKVLDQLINNDWKTNLNVQTNKKGKAEFRGFYGSYEIVVTYKESTYKKEMNLTSSGDNRFTIQL